MVVVVVVVIVVVVVVVVVRVFVCVEGGAGLLLLINMYIWKSVEKWSFLAIFLSKRFQISYLSIYKYYLP